MYSSLLENIETAWPLTPYPGDHILSDCWCDECEYAVSNLRGKSWIEITRSDLNGENARLADASFQYYMPSLLRFSLNDPDDTWVSGEIMGRFVAIEMQPATNDQQERIERVRHLGAQLTDAQRPVLAQYFRWVGEQGWQFPRFTEVATKCVLDGTIVPVPYDDVLSWARDRERELKQNAG
jgi:hypothetical protein